MNMFTEDVADVTHITRLSDVEFDLLRDLIYQQFGISLSDEKRSLVSGRLNKVLRQQGFDSFTDYYSYLTQDRSGEALETLINRISTNHTFFWREADHFEYFLDQALPQVHARLESQKNKILRIWCCGCSSGEEPYTLAMLTLEHFGLTGSSWDIGILATDISSHVLDKARQGTYSEESLAPLPSKLRSKYIKMNKSGEFEVSERAKNMVLFRRFNLMGKVWPFRGRFSIIFCRNVMIYFDRPTRDTLTDQFSLFTEEQGYLFIGHSESLGRSNRIYRYVKPAIYQKI
jgi:chemotaxis protein methyltransferase CheR